MNIFKELHETMDFFAENIAAEVSEKRLYEVAEIKDIAKTRLWIAISECLQIQVTDAEKRRRDAVAEYGKPGIPHWKKVEMGAQIAKINAEKKDANRLMHTIQDYDAFEQLKFYVKDKIGQEYYDDFFENYYNRPENKKRKKHI